MKRTLIILLIICVILAIFSIFNIPNKILKQIYIKEYSQYVEKYSKQYNVDEELVYAVIKAESNFNSNAHSSKGAVGLMQLMEDTAKDIAKKANVQLVGTEVRQNLLDSETNINLGTKYLSILIEKYQNIEVAITAYNAGIGTVDNWIEKGIIKSDGSDIENIPYKETNNYVRKILRDYKIYEKIY